MNGYRDRMNQFYATQAQIVENADLASLLTRCNVPLEQQVWFAQHCAWHVYMGQRGCQVSLKERRKRLNRVSKAAETLLAEIAQCDGFDPVPHDMVNDLKKWTSFVEGWNYWINKDLHKPTGASQKDDQYIRRAMKVCAYDLMKLEGRQLPVNEIAAMVSRALIDDPDDRITADAIAHLKPL